MASSSSSQKSDCCPKVCHDKRACVKDCSGHKKCGCVRNSDCDHSKSHHKRGPKVFACDLPCNNCKIMDMLKVDQCCVENSCKPWISHSKVYDPLMAFERCAKPACLHNLAPCDEQCPARQCESSSSSCSSSSSSSVCECVVVKKEKVCKGCSSSSSSSSESSPSRKNARLAPARAEVNP